MITFSPIVGDNGRLYFNYNPGAEVKMYDERGEYILKIISCEYVNGKEYYQVTRDGIPMLGRMSVNRLTFLLNHNQIKTLELGTPCELPLTADEVKIFADYQRRKNSREKEWVEKEIQVTGYGSLQKEYNSIAGRQAIAESRGDIEAADKYRLQMAEIEKQMSEILDKTEINLSVLTRQPCSRCNNTGFIAENPSLGICRCMKSREEEIKIFCANTRK